MNKLKKLGTSKDIVSHEIDNSTETTEAIERTPNKLQLRSSIEKKTSYHCMCPICGNEFTLNHYCRSDYCHSCQIYVSFIIEKEVTEITILEQNCPICNQYFKTSEYLNSIFKDDDKARWLANMVMHHRHDHITSWNSNWSRNGYARNHLNVDYEMEKRKVNERAKRQIVRKCKDYLIKNGFCAEDVLKLNGTELDTINLYKKYLPTNN
jgi:hypothetical protein